LHVKGQLNTEKTLNKNAAKYLRSKNAKLACSKNNMFYSNYISAITRLICNKITMSS